jgi:coproporphyrinogen III oxidase-like Fe-S oxidoreductase
MFKKRKLREKFNTVFQAGDQKAIKEMLKENPWLLEEMSEEFDEKLENQRRVIAALGIMEDDLGSFVPISKIQNSLNLDFNISKSTEEILSILKEVESLGFVQRKSDGWTLTEEGGRVCDDFLNKQLDLSEL